MKLLQENTYINPDYIVSAIITKQRYKDTEEKPNPKLSPTGDAIMEYGYQIVYKMISGEPFFSIIYQTLSEAELALVKMIRPGYEL